MLEAIFSSFQSFQAINYQQTLEVVHSIRKEIIPTMSKIMNVQMNAENKIVLDTRTENKKIIEQFEKLTKVMKKNLLKLNSIFF